MDYERLANLARPALIVAAQRRSLLTYGDLADAIGWPKRIPQAHHMKRVLDRVSDDCEKAGEPSLAALVVNAKTGAPGSGWQSGGVAWHTEVRRCFAVWHPA